MADGDLRDQITQIEADLEQLVEKLERCRKAMLVSKVGTGVGVIWILAYFVGAVGFVPAAMVGATAAVIGGVVVYGSNSSTSKEVSAAMKDGERLRAELIEKIDPRIVSRSNQLIF